MLDPSILIISEPILINTLYKSSVKLLKKSEGNADFTITLEGKNCESFDVAIEDPTSG